jgi:type IV pilus assembly protein PilO
MNIKLITEIFRARPKSLVFILVLALVNIGLYIYVSAYQAPRLAALQSEWFEKRRLAGGGVARDAAAVYRQGTKDLAAWNARIPLKKEFARFIGDLFESAANNALTVGGVTYKPVPIPDDKNLLAFSISFNVSGKYAGVKSFMADLGRLREIMTIDNISLNNTKPTEESVDMKLLLTAYFRMEG